MANTSHTDFLPFEAFIHGLQEHYGYSIGLDTWEQVVAVFNALPPAASVAQVRFRLASVIAKDPEEQERFYQLFDEYVARNIPAFRYPETRVTTEVDHPEGQVPVRPSLWQRLRPYRKYALYGLGGLALMALVAYALRGPLGRLSELTWEDIRSLFQPETDQMFMPALLERLGLGALILGSLVFLLYRSSRRRQYLRREAGSRRQGLHPQSWPFQISDALPDLFRSEAFYEAARLMRYREAGDRQVLDLPNTLRATLRSAGYPAFRYKPITRPVEYLVLIDYDSHKDHQAMLFARMTEELAALDLHMHPFYYRNTPLEVYHPDTYQAFGLSELYARFSDYNLLVFGTGDQFLARGKPELASWTEQLTHWENRALLTPKSPYQWSYREAAIAQRIPLYPAIPEALPTLVSQFGKEELPDLREWYYRNRLPKPPGDDDPLTTLRPYLGEPLFQWLCTCALYPELFWDLTIELGKAAEAIWHAQLQGQQIEPRLADHTLVSGLHVLQLIQLPWFRAGDLPDHIRTQLYPKLEPEYEHAAREVIDRHLMRRPPPPGSRAAAIQDGNRRILDLMDEGQKPVLDRETTMALGQSAEADPVQNQAVLRHLRRWEVRLTDYPLPLAEGETASWWRDLFPRGWELWAMWMLLSLGALLFVVSGTLALSALLFLVMIVWDKWAREYLDARYQKTSKRVKDLLGREGVPFVSTAAYFLIPQIDKQFRPPAANAQEESETPEIVTEALEKEHLQILILYNATDEVLMNELQDELNKVSFPSKVTIRSVIDFSVLNSTRLEANIQGVDLLLPIVSGGLAASGVLNDTNLWERSTQRTLAIIPILLEPMKREWVFDTPLTLSRLQVRESEGGSFSEVVDGLMTYVAERYGTGFMDHPVEIPAPAVQRTSSKLTRIMLINSRWKNAPKVFVLDGKPEGKLSRYYQLDAIENREDAGIIRTNITFRDNSDSLATFAEILKESLQGISASSQTLLLFHEAQGVPTNDWLRDTLTNLGFTNWKFGVFDGGQGVIYGPSGLLAPTEDYYYDDVSQKNQTAIYDDDEYVQEVKESTFQSVWNHYWFQTKEKVGRLRELLLRSTLPGIGLEEQEQARNAARNFLAAFGGDPSSTSFPSTNLPLDFSESEDLADLASDSITPDLIVALKKFIEGGELSGQVINETLGNVLSENPDELGQTSEQQAAQAISKWLGSWLKGKENSAGIIGLRLLQNHGPDWEEIALVELRGVKGNWEVNYYNRKQIYERITDPSDQLTRELLNEYWGVKLGHGSDKKEPVNSICRIRSHNSFMTYIYGNRELKYEQLASARAGNVKAAKLLETVLTRIVVFDNRIYNRLPGIRDRNLDPDEHVLRDQLGIEVYPEIPGQFMENRKNFLKDCQVLVVHGSFLKSFWKDDKTRETYNEGEIRAFFEEKIKTFYTQTFEEKIPDNFILVFTTGRGRGEWAKELLFDPQVTFRAIEALTNAIEDGLAMGDDYQIKHNLCNVLLNS